MIVTPEEQFENLEDALDRALRVLHPPKVQALSEWSAENFMIIDGGQPGRYRGDLAPFQKDMLDALSDTRYNRVVFMTSAQMIKTVALMAYTTYCIGS